MKTIRHISGSIAIILLSIMAQGIYCSAVCAVGLGTCCNEAANKKHECCKIKSSQRKESNCQNEHMAFFKAIGKYFSIHIKPNLSLFPSFVVPEYPILQVSFVLIDLYSYSNTGFHPPPSNDEIRILINSFQI